MDIYQDRFLVLESQLEDIEMYQVKMFYYQTPPGIISFRFSMSQNKCYFYYPRKENLSLSQWIVNASSEDLERILGQLLTIIGFGKEYLLYEEDFSLNPDWIYVDEEENELKLNLVYIPLKTKGVAYDTNYGKAFLDLIANRYSQLGDMEGFYHMVRISELIEEGELVSIYEGLARIHNQLNVK